MARTKKMKLKTWYVVLSVWLVVLHAQQSHSQSLCSDTGPKLDELRTNFLQLQRSMQFQSFELRLVAWKRLLVSGQFNFALNS
ncbi:hypothetical protein FHG87_017390 [Trinorchestia longiramus]|nr:hypothetical protein FHG87_017390 [Trinorchestia longiramus]